jgi:hypothetical protein
LFKIAIQVVSLQPELVHHLYFSSFFLSPLMVISTNLKILYSARHWLLMPVILVTQKAESRRISVWNQLGQINGETLSQKIIHHNKGLVSSNPSTAKKKRKKKFLYSFLYRKYITHTHQYSLKQCPDSHQRGVWISLLLFHKMGECLPGKSWAGRWLLGPRAEAEAGQGVLSSTRALWPDLWPPVEGC